MSDERDLKSHQIMELSRAIERVTALAADIQREADRGDGTQRAYDLDDVADRLRRAIAGPQ